MQAIPNELPLKIEILLPDECIGKLLRRNGYRKEPWHYRQGKYNRIEEAEQEALLK
jgi:hypothetical protein